MIIGKTTFWQVLLSRAALANTVTRMPHTSAPTISDAMFTNGVAFNMGIWLTTPTSRPMTTDW